MRNHRKLMRRNRARDFPDEISVKTENLTTGNLAEFQPSVPFQGSSKGTFEKYLVRVNSKSDFELFSRNFLFCCCPWISDCP